MRNTSLKAFLRYPLDRMFFVNKRGKIVFFPWGSSRQGYLLKSRSLMAKTKNFYHSSLFVSLVLFAIAASMFRNNFWGIIGSMFVCFGCWYLVYYLYISILVKSLPVAKASYKDIVLERLEPESTEK